MNGDCCFHKVCFQLADTTSNLDLNLKTGIVVSEKFALSLHTIMHQQLGSNFENGDCCFQKVCFQLADTRAPAMGIAVSAKFAFSLPTLDRAPATWI